jgi:hypothetical protein
VRYSLKQLLSATFGLAALVVILEHAAGFSRVLEAGSGAYATGFNALTGHSGRKITGAKAGTR